jgi:hypothetical protein
MFNNQIIAGSSGQGGGSFYPVTIDDSLRFEDGSSAYLSRTPAVAGSLTTWTWSGWVKRGNLAAGQPARGTIFSGGGGPTAFGFFNPSTNGATDNFGAYMSDGEDDRFMTNRLFRDTSAWYHLVVVWDSTNGTADDRFRLYVNGVRETSWSRFDTVTQNRTAGINSATGHGIGVQANAGSQYFDGYLSDIYLIDGQALDPTDFGETKDGVWVPKTYAGTYGTNGFHLELNGNTNDASGNGNNWTANNISAHDYVPDTITNNFAVGNPLSSQSNNTFSEGNLKVTGSGVNYYNYLSSMGMETGGKYYFEVYSNARYASYAAIGICKPSSFTHTMSVYNTAGVMGYVQGQFVKYLNNTIGSTANLYNNNPYLFSFAIDLDNNIFHFRTDGGAWENSGDPVAGTGGYAIPADLQGQTLMPWFGPNGANYQILNFGQDSTFAGTTTAGGNTDGNGKGDFQYPVPSGFLSLCSANLPDSTIGPGQTALAEDYFVPYLYTADNTSPKSRTGLGFSPDFLWFKDRTTAFSNALYDTVRGSNKGLQTNTTNAENSYTVLPSFDADGFTTQTDVAVAGNILNYSTDSYVTWAWKAGGTAVSNTDGSITSQVSANVDAGFSIVSWTGTGANATVGHGLSAKPQFIFAKNRNGTPDAWPVYSETIGAANRLYLNLTNSSSAAATIWNNTEPTAQVFSVGSASLINQSTKDIIAYCFHSVDGFSKMGSYEGNSSTTDGPFVFTGFSPSFVIGKAIDQTGRWWMYDSARTTYNDDGVNNGRRLEANSSSAETTGDSSNKVLFLSNGFKVNTSNSEWNGSGLTYIYLAFAETPAKFANAR